MPRRSAGEPGACCGVAMALFPLPLAPFEHYMLADDRSDYPMTFLVRMHFEGRFDHERLQESLGRALLWHPLLKARIRGEASDRTRNLFWIDSGPCPPSVFGDAHHFQAVSDSRIDLTC